MHRLRSALLVVAVMSLLLAWPPTAMASATPVPVALSGFSSIAVDEPHGHVFIGQGAKGGVVVSDLGGHVVATIDELVGSTDLQLSPSGETVVVALPSSREVAAVDTSTLAVTTWSTGDRCPGTLAPVDGVVWFTDTCGNGLSAVAPDGAVTTVRPFDDFSLVRTTPSAPGTVAALGDFDEVEVFDASIVDGLPTLATVTSGDSFDDVLDLDVTPDGGGILVQEYGGSPQVWSATDLGDPVGPTYREQGRDSEYLGVDDFRADGALLVGEDVFEALHADPLVVLDFGGYLRGADWGAQRLYAVVEAGGRPRGRFSLQVLSVRAPSEVTIKAADRTLPIGERTGLSLTLATRSARREVVVRAVTAAGSKVIARPRVPIDGRMITVEPRRNTTYVVRYAGGDDVSPSEASTAVGVVPRLSLVALDAAVVRHGVAYYRSGRTARLRASVEAYPGGCVTFDIYFRRIREWIFADSVKCVHLNRQGLADLKVRSEAGKSYYASRVVAFFVPNDDNISGHSRGRQLQFCQHGVPCKAPVG